MSEEPPKPINQEDVQALDELRENAIANGTYAEQAKAFADQAESIGVDASQRYSDAENSESSGVVRPTTTEDVQGAIAEYNDTSSEMSEVGPSAVASVAQEPWTIGTSNEDNVSNETEQPPNTPENPEDTSPDDDLYKEYSKAVRDESETFSVKDQETGKFVQKKAKDLNFREWLSATEKKKAAKWYTQTRPHGEAPDELDIDHPSEEDIQRTLDKDHQERLNAQEGKANPTEDDKAYYRWLKGNGGQEEPGTGNSPEEDDSTNGKEPWDKYSRNKKRPGDEDPRTVEIPVDEDPGTSKGPENDGPGTAEIPGDDDPRKKIGDAINKRIEELTAGGMSESDAHAQAHDEFWGKEPIGDEDPTGVIDFIKTPEMIEVEEELEIARDELARLQAGRERTTFLSIRFSKKKLEAATERYQEIKAKAEAMAFDFLESKGLSRESIKSAANFGRFVEASKLIVSQYGVEMERISKQNPKTRKFLEWWSKNSGGELFSKKNMKKSAVLGLIGLPIGFAVGMVASPLISGGSAAIAGVAMMRGISKGILGHRIGKEASANLAEAKAVSRIEHLKAVTDKLESQNEELAAEMVDTLNSRLVESAKKGNDREARKALLIAGTVGAISGWLANYLHGAGSGGGHTPDFPSGPGPNGPTSFSIADFKQGIYGGVAQQGPDVLNSADTVLNQLNSLGVQPSPAFNQLANQVVEQGAQGVPKKTLEGISRFLGRSVNHFQGGTITPEQLLSIDGVGIIRDGVTNGLSDEAIRNLLAGSLETVK